MTSTAHCALVLLLLGPLYPYDQHDDQKGLAAQQQPPASSHRQLLLAPLACTIIEGQKRTAATAQQ
jgi:hypothetical protein